MEPRPPSTDHDELLAQLGWMRTLARRLARDPDVADDVLQRACLLALQRPPEVAPGGAGLRAWLATVLRRVAGHRRRAESRRESREHIAAAPEALPATIDIAARREILQRLVEALTTLEEPGFSTIVRRYYEGRSTLDIAAQDGVSPEVVRQRLQRARVRLRARLVAQLDPRWLPALALLSPRAAPAAPTALQHPVMKGLFMAERTARPIVWKATAAVVAVALGAGAWSALGSAPDDARTPPVAALATVPAAPNVGPALPTPPSAIRALAPPAEPARDATREATAGPAPSTLDHALLVMVVDSQGAPVAEAQVFLKSDPMESVQSDTHGVAGFTMAAGAEFAVAARHPDYRFAIASAVMPQRRDAPFEFTVVLEKQLSVCVHVTGESGEPIAGARISFREIRHNGYLGQFVGGPDEFEGYTRMKCFDGVFHEQRLSGADGSCCVAGVTPGPMAISVEAAGYVGVSERDFEVGDRGGDLGVIQLAAGNRVEGIVTDSLGPVPGAVVQGLLDDRSLRAITEDDGTFVLGDVPRDARWIELRATHASRGEYYHEREALTGAGLRLALQPSLNARLVLLDGSTSVPIERQCLVTPLGIEGQSLLVQLREGQTMKLVDGEVRVDGVPRSGTGLGVEVPEYARIVVDLPAIIAAAGEPIELHLSRQGVIAVRLLDANTGQLVVGGTLHVLTEKKVASTGALLPGWRTAEARFDEGAGAYIVDVSVFEQTAGQDEFIDAVAPGYVGSDRVPMFRNGAWVGSPAVSLTLKHE